MVIPKLPTFVSVSKSEGMVNMAFLIGAYCFMEFIAWSNHKFVMHGFLWDWHKDHHINDQKKVVMHEMTFSGMEKNDRFFLVYATPAIILLILGLYFDYPKLVFTGVGITLYGFTYFWIHDILIHQRIKLPFLSNIQNSYTRAIINAHHAHHRPRSRNDFTNYGLLVFPLRFFKSSELPDPKES